MNAWNWRRAGISCTLSLLDFEPLGLDALLGDETNRRQNALLLLRRIDMSSRILWICSLLLFATACASSGSARQGEDELVERRIESGPCSGLMPDACVALAIEEMEDSEGGIEEVLELFDLACEHGSHDGCARHAMATVQRSTSSNEIRQAFERADAACSNDVIRGCIVVATMFLQGQAVTPDAQSAADYFHRACHGPEEEQCGTSTCKSAGCMGVGMMYGGNFRLPFDPDRVDEYLGMACGLNDPVACQAYVDFYATGRGRDLDFAIEIEDDACRAGVPTLCLTRGIRFMSFEGTRRDPDVARQAFELGCQELDDVDNCLFLAFLEEQEENSTRAEEIFDRICFEWDLPDYCAQIAYEKETAQLITRDMEGAMRYYGRACELGESRACERIE